MRNRADLSDSDKEIYRKLSAELSSLTLKFAQNHLKETNNFELVLTDKNELEGLPESTVEAARHAAEEKGKKDCWMFTLQAPAMCLS